MPTRRGTCATRSSRRFPCSRSATRGRTCRPRSRSRRRGRTAYKFLFIAKGGGSANKTFLFQATPSILSPERLVAFLREKILTLGTAACPPYHLAIVVGGTSAEMTLKAVKLASARYLDALPTAGSELGHAFRDLEMEGEVHRLTHSLGVGAQFGGKYFCHDVRVIRLPRHGASLPIGLGVSCSADRQALGKITREGVFLEELERNPARFMPEIDESPSRGRRSLRIDLTRPMPEILGQLSRHPIRTRVSLTRADDRRARPRPCQAARAAGGGRRAARLHARTTPSTMPGRPRRPTGYASGSFGPTTAGRMDAYVDQFQAAGGSMVMLAKGNRSASVSEACAKHGGFYLGSIGGPAARLARDCIRKVEPVEYEELGMEAVWRIEVEDFPAFIVIDDKGNDFFKDLGI